MTKEDVDRWLAAYVEAWRTYDRGQVESLFADDISYRYHPYDDPIEGREAVVEAWLNAGESSDASEPDQPGTYDAQYKAVAVDGDTAVATGSSSYKDSPDGPVARTYDNCFVMRFADDGRCREFTEWFIKRPSP